MTYQNPIFDREAALARVEGDVELLREIAQLFLDTCDDMVLEVRTALLQRDHAALHISAHTLKGAVANFGAHQATQAALALEMRGRQNQLEGADMQLLELQVSLQSLKQVLASFVRSA